MPSPLRSLLTPKFSLRALLLVVTVGCLTLGWRANRYFQIQRAITSLNNQGLDVNKSYEPGRTVSLDLRFFGKLDVEEIDLVSPDRYPSDPATRADSPANRIWSDLSKFSPLHKLTFRGVDFPTAIESSTEKLGDATHVHLSLCKFPQNALRHAIERLPQLKSLNIGCCAFDSRELASLGDCKQLTTLELRENSVAPDVISSIGPTTLRRLKMSAVAVALRVELSAKDVQAIVSMPNLEELEIFAMPGFPVESLPQLKKCKKLKVLNLDVTGVSKEGLRAIEAELREALPGCSMQLFSSSG